MSQHDDFGCASKCRREGCPEQDRCEHGMLEAEHCIECDGELCVHGLTDDECELCDPPCDHGVESDQYCAECDGPIYEPPNDGLTDDERAWNNTHDDFKKLT